LAHAWEAAGISSGGCVGGAQAQGAARNPWLGLGRGGWRVHGS